MLLSSFLRCLSLSHIIEVAPPFDPLGAAAERRNGCFFDSVRVLGGDSGLLLRIYCFFFFFFWIKVLPPSVSSIFSFVLCLVNKVSTHPCAMKGWSLIHGRSCASLVTAQKRAQAHDYDDCLFPIFLFLEASQSLVYGFPVSRMQSSAFLSLKLGVDQLFDESSFSSNTNKNKRKESLDKVDVPWRIVFPLDSSLLLEAGSCWLLLLLLHKTHLPPRWLICKSFDPTQNMHT